MAEHTPPDGPDDRDRLITDGLRRIQEDAERSALPLSPTDVRQLGNRRRQQRQWGAVGGAVAAAVLVVAGVFGVNTLRHNAVPDPAFSPSQASPVPSPSTAPTATPSGTPTVTPSATRSVRPTSSASTTKRPTPTATTTTKPPGIPELGEKNLPRAADMAWFDYGDWKVTSTYPGSGQATLNRCQRGSFDIGADSVYTREFAMGTNDASAVVMQFTDRGSMEAMQTSIEQSMSTCPSRLKKNGFKNVSDISSNPVDDQSVFSELSFTDPDDADLSIFVATGTVADTKRLRLAFVTMESHGQDNNWDYEPNGEVGMMHPMFRTLPKVAARLR